MFMFKVSIIDFFKLNVFYKSKWLSRDIFFDKRKLWNPISNSDFLGIIFTFLKLRYLP